MKILIIGGGGREHALAWKARQSAGVESVLVAPGNAGTALEDGVRNVAIAADDIEGLLALARKEAVDLTLVGPEAPLVAGVVDAFGAAGLACFGPKAVAAQLEGSKAFTKAFLERYNIPTARYFSVTDLDAAQKAIAELGVPVVVKADGLAAGKGVTVANSEAEALEAARNMLSGDAFGAAGERLVIEEFLHGEEASFIVVTDGQTALSMPSSQDHKARDDGDRGPNTGGMGAYSPAPVIDAALEQRILSEVIEPTLNGLAAEGLPYCGFLYAGLMIAADGTPKVLEYNCRLGDPEAQPLLMRLQSDLVALCRAALDGTLAQYSPRWDSRPALGVVMAAQGYPDRYAKGESIRGLDQTDGVKIFHAGTALDAQGDVVSNGGRVLCITALGQDIAEAQQRAYAAAEQIEWPGGFMRRDIGYRAIARR